MKQVEDTCGIFIRSLCAAVFLGLCFGWGGIAFAQSLDQKLVLEGKVHYSVTWEVRNSRPGEMESIVVEDSQAVKKSDVLGRYVMSEYTRGGLQRQIADTVLQQKKLQLDEARSKLRSLTRDFQALLKMYDNGMASQSEIDPVKDQVVQGKDLIEYLEQDVSREETRLKQERDKLSEELGGASLRSGRVPKIVNLVSPIDGMVVWRIDEAQWKLDTSKVCFKVADVDHAVLKAKVFVEDYPKLAEGMVATVTAKGQPGKEFNAVLSKLPLTPIDQGFAALSYYLVEFEMDNSEHLLREGYRVTLTLEPQSVEKPRPE